MSYKELWSYEAPKAIEFWVRNESAFCTSPNGYNTGGSGTYDDDDINNNGGDY